MYTEVFPSRLKMAREYSGATQVEVSKVIKISQSTYAGYETGRSEPNIETIAILSKMFDVSTDWLLGVSHESHIGSNKYLKEEIARQKILKKMEKEAELHRKAYGA
jgi:transcriptional regulator with XRE-family HTH domain